MHQPTPEQILTIARKAGAVILEEYAKTVPAEINWKADDSPLTMADQRSHKLIETELAALTPDIPLLSEEGMETPHAARRKWAQFWCVDPMDGTKEFIKKSGQFTVNIALIEAKPDSSGTNHWRPVLGVIFVPALSMAYFAERGRGAFRVDGIPAGAVSKRGEVSMPVEPSLPVEPSIPVEPSLPVEQPTPKPIQTRPANMQHLAIVASKDHAGPAVKALIEAHPQAETRSMGSSLKFCLVAEGKADIYYRDVPTFEWDTAAAQIIVEEAGGTLTKATGEPLPYNKENLRNPSIVTTGDRHGDWIREIQP